MKNIKDEICSINCFYIISILYGDILKNIFKILILK
jgi:hypothetical protein